MVAFGHEVDLRGSGYRRHQFIQIVFVHRREQWQSRTLQAPIGSMRRGDTSTARRSILSKDNIDETTPEDMTVAGAAASSDSSDSF